MPRRSARTLLLLAAAPGIAVVFLSFSASAPKDVIAGQVIAEDGPAGDAVLRIKGMATCTRSDAQGNFRLAREPNARRVTASKPGYLIAGTSLDTFPLRLVLKPLPKEDNRDYQWVDPDPDPLGEHNCANCHAEIHREWKESGHARSATSRQFLDLYTGKGGGWSLRGQKEEGLGVCSSCHGPAIPPGDPGFRELDKASGVGAKGVHCDYCHKVTGLGDGDIGKAHGRDLLSLLRPSEGQLFFGPLDDVDRGEDAYSPFYKDSRYCASCHEGNVFGVHVYSTYSEWLASPARGQGLHCQDCHMKPTGKMTNIAPGKGGIERDPKTLGNHRFFAGSREEMLRQSLKLETEATRGADGVRVAIRLRAEGVGHRVPTGFIDRHLILSVEAKDNEGRSLEMMEGERLPSAAGLALGGRPGKLFAKLLADESGHAPAPFWKSQGEPQDSRLFPGHADASGYRFPLAARLVIVRLLHRKFWEEVSRGKGWPDNTLHILSRELHP